MSEVDIGIYDLIIQFNLAGMTAMALYLTAVSGYLLMAYMIGRNLTTLQCSIITGLFLWFTLFITIGTAGYFGRAIQLIDLLEFAPSGIKLAPWVIWGSSGFEFVGIFASLKFMWDVRHPKTE